MNNNKTKIAIVFVLGIILGYASGGYLSSKNAYKKALADIQAQQETLATKAAEEAAKTANPFKVANPLEGVKANPFAEAQKALNPFSQ